MNLIVLASIAAIAVFAVYFFRLRYKTLAPSGHNEQPVTNESDDKMIIVTGPDFEAVRQAAQQFCNLYGNQGDIIDADMIKLPGRKTAFIFPSAINLEHYCLLINYLNYPEGISYSTTIRAWATIGRAERWDGTRLPTGKAMFFIPADDNEYDNVFMTTVENKGYKISFASGPTVLQNPGLYYEETTMSYDELRSQPFETIRPA